jgi:hypothetical protein
MKPECIKMGSFPFCLENVIVALHRIMHYFLFLELDTIS